MAQNVTIQGATYSAVPAVELPKSGGGTATFYDVSDTSATVADVALGKTFYTSSGEQTGTGVAIITSTYNSGNVTLNTDAVTAAWWGGLNPERCWEANYTLQLKDTNYTSKTPSTSAQMLTEPATSYTSSASTKVIYDRWGSAYHSGSKLDFANYDYFVLSKTMVNVAYTSTESSLGIIHSCQHQQMYFYPIGQGYKISSNNLIHPTSSTAGTTRIHAMGLVATIYRNASNNIGVGASTSYGVYPTANAPGLQSTSSLTPTYISFYAPSWSIRTHASTYMAAAAWAYVDAENTTLTNVQTLYKVRKQDIVEQAWEQMASMWENKTIPAEVI